MKDNLRARVVELHEHLQAAQELPVERTASRWIGEAEAIAADLVTADVAVDVLHKRLSHIRELLSNVDRTEHAAADEHVAAAERIAADLLNQLGDE